MKSILTLIVLIIGATGATAIRGRVEVINNGAWDYSTQTYDSETQGRTVVTDQGTLLRGASFWCMTFHSWAIRYANNYESWKRLPENGLNTVRLSVHNWTPDLYGDSVHYSDSEWLEQIDQWVDWAEGLGLYIIIDHHEVGGHTQERLRQFWTYIAPRYRHRTHVLYEMANEPVGWHVSDYTEQDIADQQEIYDLIRSYAPRTHVIVLSFAVPDPGMDDIARQLEIDWNNASVGFHGYWSSDAQPINELKKQFPVINTEFTSPNTTFAGSLDPYFLDGYNWQQELMEKLRISWNIWDANYKSASRSTVMLPMIAHATENEYLWPADDYEQPGIPDFLFQGWFFMTPRRWAYSGEMGWIYYYPSDEGVWIYSARDDTWQPG